MAYADIATYKAYGYSTTAMSDDHGDEDALIDQLLQAAQAEIEAFTERRFEATTETRAYGEANARISGRTLYLDEDLLTLTALTDGYGQVIPLSGVTLEPRNTPPYSMLRLRSSYAWLLSPDQDIEVTGTWGWSATPPADIVQATVELTKYLYDLRQTQTAEVSAIPEMGQIKVPSGMPKHVAQLLGRYVRRGW